MGKYGKLTTQKTEPSETFKIRMLQAIANELEKANRLKRIEIKHQYLSTKLDHNGFSYDEEGLDKLLEDKA